MSKTAAQRQKAYRERRKQKEGANYFKSESSRVRNYYVKTNLLSECQKYTRRKKTRDNVRNHRRATRACRYVSSKTEGKVVPDNINMVPDDSNMVPDDSNMVPDDSNMVPDDSNMVTDNSNMVTYDSNMVPYDRNMVPYDSNMVPDDSNIVPDDSNMLHIKSPTYHAQRQKEYRERKKQKEGSNFLKCERSRVKKYYKNIDPLSECEKRIRREKNRGHVRNYVHRQRAAKDCREGYVVPADTSSSSYDVTSMLVKLPGIAPCKHSKRRERTSQRISEAHVKDDVNDETLSLLRLVESVGTMDEELVCITEKYVYVPSSIATAEVEEGMHVYHQEEPDPSNYEDFPVLPDNVNNVCHAECFSGLVKIEVFNDL